MDETFEKFREDTKTEMQKFSDDNKKEKDQDARTIKDLQKQLQDAEIFKSKKEEYDRRIS